jgi:transglutaminase-like putative cysteine protease
MPETPQEIHLVRDVADPVPPDQTKSQTPDHVPSQTPMRYRIRHTTTCEYTEEIQHAQHTLHLNPRALPRQAFTKNQITLEPPAARLVEHVDYFGNPITYLALEIPHKKLLVQVDFEVEVLPPPNYDLATTPPWEEIKATIYAPPDALAKDSNLFAFSSTMVPPLPGLVEYAARSFPAGRPVGEAAFDLISRIHADFVFDPVATTVATPLVDVLVNKRGVCQDFAHLAIGCLRGMGLAARYVSGYLRTVPPPGQPRLVGADATHAWLSVWCGGDMWVDLDPTNGTRGSTDMVTLCWGRDYDDVSPMRGVLIGGGSQTLTVQVDVAPVDESGQPLGEVTEAPMQTQSQRQT